jgi:hypothetical protein
MISRTRWQDFSDALAVAGTLVVRECATAFSDVDASGMECGHFQLCNIALSVDPKPDAKIKNLLAGGLRCQESQL